MIALGKTSISTKAILISIAIATGGLSTAATAEPVSKSQLALNGYWRGVVTQRGPGAGPPGAGPPQGGGRPGGPGVPDGRGPPVDTFSGIAAPLLKPEGAAFRNKYRAAEAAGEQQRTPNNLCLPSAVPGTGVPGGPAYGIEILLEANQVTFLYEENRTARFVYMGKDHPADPGKTWLGHSVGHWEGETLVIDTLGFNDVNLLTEGMPMSHQMHVVQRLRMVGDHLEDKATFDDPGMFTAPFTVTYLFERSAPFQEYICAENNNEGGVPTASGQPTPSELPRTMK